MVRAARQITEHFAPDRDGPRFAATAALCTVAIYAVLAAASLGAVPVWMLAVTVSLLVPRWMISIHELLHLRSEREVDVVTRLQPLLFTLFSVGYRENLVNHRGHHRYMCTRQDPEYYQLRGSPWRGFFNASTAPEQLWFRWVAEHGMATSCSSTAYTGKAPRWASIH